MHLVPTLLFGSLKSEMIQGVTWWQSETYKSGLPPHQRASLSTYQHTDGIGTGNYEDRVQKSNLKITGRDWLTYFFTIKRWGIAGKWFYVWKEWKYFIVFMPYKFTFLFLNRITYLASEFNQFPLLECSYQIAKLFGNDNNLP